MRSYAATVSDDRPAAQPQHDAGTLGQTLAVVPRIETNAAAPRGAAGCVPADHRGTDTWLLEPHDPDQPIEPDQPAAGGRRPQCGLSGRADGAGAVCRRGDRHLLVADRGRGPGAGDGRLRAGVGDVFPVGPTRVTCTATDAAAATATCGFDVNVQRVPQLTRTKFLAFGDSVTAGEVTAPALGGATFGPWLDRRPGRDADGGVSGRPQRAADPSLFAAAHHRRERRRCPRSWRPKRWHVFATR